MQIFSNTYALDIEPAMMNAVKDRAQVCGLANMVLMLCDLLADGSGLA